MEAIWKDRVTSFSASTPYVIEADGVGVFSGRCDMQPNGDCCILSNKACQYYLHQDFPAGSGVQRNADACKTFVFKDFSGNTLATEQFIYDWSYEDEVFGHNVLSSPVNGHLDSRMRLMWSAFNSAGAIAEVQGLGDDGRPVPDTGNPEYYATQYLTFDILTGGTLMFTTESSAAAVSGSSVDFSKDGGNTWTRVPISKTASASTIAVYSGDRVMVRRFVDDQTRTVDGYTWFTPLKFSGTAYANVSGNLMSILYGDNFRAADLIHDLDAGYTGEFSYLFSGMNIVSAENLALPSMTLQQGCYSFMFYGCHELVAGPTLPATTLVENCFMAMFEDCWKIESIKCLAESGIDIAFLYGGWLPVGSEEFDEHSGTFTKSRNATWPTGAKGIPANWTVISV